MEPMRVISSNVLLIYESLEPFLSFDSLFIAFRLKRLRRLIIIVSR